MQARRQRKTRIGVVSSDKSDKTITVMVTRRVKHPKYGVYVKRDKKYRVHDETDQCRMGDKVRIMESRPLSKTKRWRVVETLEKAPVL